MKILSPIRKVRIFSRKRLFILFAVYALISFTSIPDNGLSRVLMTFLFIFSGLYVAFGLGVFLIRRRKRGNPLFKLLISAVLFLFSHFLFQHLPDSLGLLVCLNVLLLVTLSIVVFNDIIDLILLVIGVPVRLFPGKFTFRNYLRLLIFPFRKATGYVKNNLITVGILTVLVVIIRSQSARISILENRLGGPQVLSCDEKSVISSVKKSTVRVVGAEMQGTGIIVREDGIIATNYHVIATEASPKIIFTDNSFRTADIVYTDESADIALLKVEGGGFTAIPLRATAGLSLFEPLFVTGFPMGTNLKGEATVNSGKFVSWRVNRNSPVSFIQIDADINNGNSGGPVTDACGRFVGMATSGLPGLGLAIVQEAVTDRVNKLPATGEKIPAKETVKLEPEKGPVETVTAFYTYLKMRKLEKAFELLSPKKIRDGNIDTFRQGYSDTIDDTLIEIHPVAGKENTVYVKFVSTDWKDSDISYGYYDGEWKVEKEEGQWRMTESSIFEEMNPDWKWFMPTLYPEKK